jgi:hypothetical protein
VERARSLVQIQRRFVGEWLALVLCTALGSFIALVLTNARCGAVNMLAASVRPSSYCRLLHFPSLPNSAGSVLLAFGVFALPTMLALIGATVAGRPDNHVAHGRTAVLCATGVAGSFILIAFAHVSAIGVD